MCCLAHSMYFPTDMFIIAVVLYGFNLTHFSSGIPVSCFGVVIMGWNNNTEVKLAVTSKKCFLCMSFKWWGHAVAQLVEALRYKLEGRGFDSRWCPWNFSLTCSFRPHYGPWVDSASNRNEYQEYLVGGKGGQCVGLTTLPASCANSLEIWEPQPPGTHRACPGL